MSTDADTVRAVLQEAHGWHQGGLVHRARDCEDALAALDRLAVAEVRLASIPYETERELVDRLRVCEAANQRLRGDVERLAGALERIAEARENGLELSPARMGYIALAALAAVTPTEAAE